MDDEAQFTLALTHHQAGRLDQAAAIYRALLAAYPRHPDALHLLGLIENRQGRACAAVDLIRQAIALRADVPGFRLSLADAHYAQGDWLAAEQACRAAIALDPALATAHNHLGVMLKGQDRLQDAEQAYRTALQLHPDYTEAWSNLGNVLKQSGKPHAAEQCYREALRRDAKTPQTWNNLGNALQHLSRMDEAEAAYRQAIALKPDFVEAWYNLGIVLGESTRLEEAIAAYMQALQYDFGNTSALDELVQLMLRACLWEGLHAALDELMRRFRARQADLNPYSLLDLPATAAEQLQCGKSRAEKIAAAAAPRFAHTPPAALPARIRIGYLSYDYRPHPVAFLIGELFTLHDAEKFEVYALSIGPDDASPTRQHFRDSCAHFIDLAPLSHIEAARTIHDLGIHVLVDLTGYTTGARAPRYWPCGPRRYKSTGSATRLPAARHSWIISWPIAPSSRRNWSAFIPKRWCGSPIVINLTTGGGRSPRIRLAAPSAACRRKAWSSLASIIRTRSCPGYSISGCGSWIKRPVPCSGYWNRMRSPPPIYGAKRMHGVSIQCVSCSRRASRSPNIWRAIAWRIWRSILSPTPHTPRPAMPYGPAAPCSHAWEKRLRRASRGVCCMPRASRNWSRKALPNMKRLR